MVYNFVMGFLFVVAFTVTVNVVLGVLSSTAKAAPAIAKGVTELAKDGHNWYQNHWYHIAIGFIVFGWIVIIFF